jgi:REP element-mobilizing transposase RayT
MEQYVKWPPPTERMIEQMQEQLFREYGPFYHLSTKPLENGIIFQDDEERRIAMNWVAILSKEFNIEVLAFALMSNHFHFIVKGRLIDGLTFFRMLKKRLSTFFSRKGRTSVMDHVDVDPNTPAITSLKQFRNEIAYVIRNPYVARTDVNPFAWPWCSGYLYFNPFLLAMDSQPVETLTFRERREITRSSDVNLDPSFRVRNGMILPESFVNYQLVEQLFPHAQKFAWWVLKNVEAQIETAERLGEKPFLNDDELFVTTQQLARSLFTCDGVKDLSIQQRKVLAVNIKTKWSASNGQVARMAQLDPKTVDEMFPLAAKPKY